jgi:hypothetical protein
LKTPGFAGGWLFVLSQQLAEAWFNGKVFLLVARSGFGSMTIPHAFQIHLDPQCTDFIAGDAIKEVLSHCWELTLEDLKAEPRFMSSEESKAIYMQWLDPWMKLHRYKTQKSFFKNMLLCNIRCVDNKIVFA